MRLNKRIAAGVLACVMAMSMLTACGGGGGGSNGGGNKTSTNDSTADSSTDGGDSDQNMGSDITGNTYESSRLKAVSDEYASAGAITMDADMVSTDEFGVTKASIFATQNGTNSYIKATFISDEAETEEERWDKDGTVYYYNSTLSEFWEEDNKIIIEFTPETQKLLGYDSFESATAFNSEDELIESTFKSLGMQKAPSSFTDGKTYYAEQVEYNTSDEDRIRVTYYFSGKTVVYASTYNITDSSVTDLKYNSLSPSFDSSKMTVGGNGYRIVETEEFIVKSLSSRIDPDNPSSDDSSNKKIFTSNSSDVYVQWIKYLRSLKNPSEATTKWLKYYDSL